MRWPPHGAFVAWYGQRCGRLARLPRAPDGGPADVSIRPLRQARQPPGRGRVSTRPAVGRFGPEPVAQLPLDDLAVVVGRQGIDEPVVLGSLEPRDVVEAGPVEILGRRLGDAV